VWVVFVDFDATDDPVHGRREGWFFNAFHDEYCFLSLYVFAAEHLAKGPNPRFVVTNLDSAS